MSRIYRLMPLIILAAGIILKVTLFEIDHAKSLGQAFGTEIEIQTPLRGDNVCTPFDIVFLVDQSGSMSRDEANDPDDQRIAAIQWVIRNVGFQNLFVCDNDTNFRLAVVPFGGTIDPDHIPFENLNPSNANEWDVQLASLLPIIEPKNLFETDFKIAFDKAEEMFELLPQSSSTQNLKKAIVVITDGAACSSDMEQEGRCGSGDSVRNYMSELEDQITLDFDPEEFYLWVVGINRYDELSVEEQKWYEEAAIIPWEKITQQYLEGSGYVQLGKGPNQIPVTFVSILEELSELEGDDRSCGPVAVNPYLERVQLNFFRNTQESPVEIQIADREQNKSIFIDGVEQPGGQLNVDFEYYADGLLNETYIFHHPEPGIWNITMPDPSFCEELRAQFFQIAATPEKIGPTGGLPQYPDKDVTGLDYEQADPYYLEYRIVDRFGEPLPDYGNVFPIDAPVAITSPSGVQHSRNFVYDNSSGYWRTDDPLPTSELGRYSFKLVGITANTEQTGDIIVIPEQEGFYDISQAVSRFTWAIETPANNTRSQIWDGFACWTSSNDVEVEILLLDYGAPDLSPSQRTPIEPNGILIGDPSFTLNILLRDSNSPIHQSDLVYVGNVNDPGRFRAVIPGEIMSQQEEYKLHVIRNAEVSSQWGERGIVADVTDVVTIFRSESFATSQAMCMITQISIGLLIVIAIIVFLYLITGKPRGFLHFIDPNSSEIGQISVTGNLRWTTLSGNRLGAIAAYIPVTKIQIWREGSTRDHNSPEDGVPSIRLSIHGQSEGEKETYLENEVIRDQEAFHIIDGYYVRYTRRGI
ncbi:MAG: VWA domain-containing protein [Chloroflexi bacterium]|nr:MAG: VWA domain-containing protein [Chloroflexota bacterium]